MAQNPKYHHWIFRKPAAKQHKLQDAVLETDLEDLENDEPAELTDFQKTMEHRRRIELLDEARLLKAHLNDLW